MKRLHSQGSDFRLLYIASSFIEEVLWTTRFVIAIRKESERECGVKEVIRSSKIGTAVFELAWSSKWEWGSVFEALDPAQRFELVHISVLYVLDSKENVSLGWTRVWWAGKRYVQCDIYIIDIHTRLYIGYLDVSERRNTIERTRIKVI